VIDGDTIRLQGESVRLNGIDAPESRQLCDNASGGRYACGRAAANALDEFLAASRPTRCEFVTRDRYRRFVGTCFRADGADVSAWLVRNGHAVDWIRYSHGRYLSDQAVARADKAGIWQGEFQMPWDWRSANK
jgi:endonuclease YncB( thermonuclease family)